MTDGRMAIRKRKRTISKVSHSLKKWKVTPHKDGRDLDNRDIIQRLDSYMLHGVVEQIFGYVDYDSLVNAQRVSPEWRMILENEKIWKALLRRNVRFDQSWRKMFNQLKIQATNGASNANDETYITKKICIQIGSLHRQLIGILSSLLHVMTTTTSIMSKLLETLKYVFGSHSDLDCSDMDSD